MTRAPLDRYDTPQFANAILAREVPELRGGLLLDPCAGNCAMASYFSSRFDRVLCNDLDAQTPAPFHYDLRRRALWEGLRPSWVITNPPFFLVGEMINYCLDYCRAGFALLVRLSVLEVCKGRERLSIAPPQRTIVLPRIRFSGRGTDSVTCAWLVWAEAKLSGPPTVCISRRESQSAMHRDGSIGRRISSSAGLYR